MVHLTILRDTRERKPWEFENFPVDTQNETITTGDYTLAEFCDHDEERDTYYPSYAIERKGGRDFVNSITRDRDRFQDEIKRASDWENELQVLIEEPKTLFSRERGFMKHNKVTTSQIFGTIESWERYYNVNFRFAGSRERCQQIAFDILSSRLRSTLVSD